MQLYELAKEVDLTSAEVAKLLGREGQSAHVTTVTEDDQEIVRATVKADAKPDIEASEVVRFVSAKQSHMVPFDGGRTKQYLRFENFSFVAERGSKQAKAIAELGSSEIKTVKDEPYEDEDERARFDKYIRGRCYPGLSGQEFAMNAGMHFLQAVLSPEEMSSASSPGAAIQRILATKSFEEMI